MGHMAKTFFLMEKVPNDAAVRTPFDLYEFMRVVEQDSVLGNIQDKGLVPRSDPAWSFVFDENATPCLKLQK